MTMKIFSENKNCNCCSNKVFEEIFKINNMPLITGGSGYVGSRLIYQLLQETDLKIVNYDISLFGDGHLPKDEKFIYIKGDITNPISFEKAIRENKIDIVLHLACISNDPTYELNSELSKKINFECFEDLVI